jgi:microcystin-dependent protein
MAFWKWSRTASSNATADNTINWAEGMAPSAVNDSARAMMARLAEWRDDVSGTIATAGTSTAYTVASNQGFDNFADMNGAMIAFVPHTTSGATVTLNVDGLGGKPLRSAPGVELPSGVMVQGTPYVATYNNADGAWYLQGYTINPYTIPIGGLMPYLGATAPNSSFVLPFGQAISRTTYATLFALVGTTFGGGDGSTTFNVLDLRGRGIFGQDNMGGSAANRITVAGGNFDGTVLGGTGGAQNHTLTTAEMPVHAHGVTDPGHIHSQDGKFNTVVGTSGGGLNALANGSQIGITGSMATGISINNAGSGGAHTVLNPAMVLPYILRII